MYNSFDDVPDHLKGLFSDLLSTLKENEENLTRQHLENIVEDEQEYQEEQFRIKEQQRINRQRDRMFDLQIQAYDDELDAMVQGMPDDMASVANQFLMAINDTADNAFRSALSGLGDVKTNRKKNAKGKKDDTDSE